MGFEPTCECGGDTKPGMVYDPFSGTGTVAVVARRLGRNYGGSELNPDYIAISDYQLRKPFEAVPSPHNQPLDDLPLFKGLA